MSSRRRFLRSALVLPSALACSSALSQNSTSSSSFSESKSSKCFTRNDIPADIRKKYDRIVRLIYIEIWKPENEFQVGDTVLSISKRLSRVSTDAIQYTRSDDSVVKALLQAETIVAWIRSNVTYWTEMNSFPGKERVIWNAPEKVLSHMPRPKCNCDGFSRLTEALATSMGVSVLEVGGAFRDIHGNIGAGADTKYLQGIPWNHGWNLFKIGEKYLPVDVTGSWKFVDEKFRAAWQGKTDSCNALPLDAKEWDIFIGSHRMLHIGRKPVEEDFLTTMPLKLWLASSPAYLENARTELRTRDINRNKALSLR